MKFDLKQFIKLKMLDPLTIGKHVTDIIEHEGPHASRAAKAKSIGWAAAVGTEVMLGLVIAPATRRIPLIGKTILMPVFEAAAPFAAMRVGVWVEHQAMHWLTWERRKPAQRILGPVIGPPEPTPPRYRLRARITGLAHRLPLLAARQPV